MHNTQHSFQLYGDGLEITSIIDNLIMIGASMLTPINPNFNWHNQSQLIRTKQLFQCSFQQVHLSASSCNIGLECKYIISIGRAAILTFGLWSLKISQSSHDLSGYGTYSITTLQGKGNERISFIAAYFAVSKGSDIGVDSLYAQQVTYHEKHRQKMKLKLNHHYCPRSDAIKRLDVVIHDLQ
jgi:hypothetical protein